jgi:cytochrome c-type biogenesis protein CcmF
MGIGPTIAWRKASVENIKKNFLVPAAAALAGLGRYLRGGIYTSYALAGVTVVCFVATTIFLDFGKLSVFWAKRLRVDYLRGLLTAFTKNQRRYAGLLTHLGVLVLITGIIASTIYQKETVVRIGIGDEFRVGAFSFKFIRLHDVKGPNWIAQEGVFQVFRDNRLVTEMRPQKRLYTESQTPTTESAIYALNMGHLFLTMPETSPDGTVLARGLINPLILWVWGGGAMMGVGVILNIFRPYRVETGHTIEEPA